MNAGRRRVISQLLYAMSYCIAYCDSPGHSPVGSPGVQHVSSWLAWLLGMPCLRGSNPISGNIILQNYAFKIKTETFQMH